MDLWLVISFLGVALALYIKYTGPEIFWTKVATIFRLKIIYKGKVVRDYGNKEENKRYFDAMNSSIQDAYNSIQGVKMSNNNDLEIVEAVQISDVPVEDKISYVHWLKERLHENAMVFAYDDETASFFDVANVENEDYETLRVGFINNTLAEEELDYEIMITDYIDFKCNRVIATLSEVEAVVNFLALRDINESLGNVYVKYVFLVDRGDGLRMHRVLEKVDAVVE